MKKRFSILLLLLILLEAPLIGSLNVCKAQTFTEVNGLISSDTTWTTAKSPYTLTGPVLVNNGATLIIEPGVTVDFGNNYKVQP
jgi:hypothetical protein